MFTEDDLKQQQRVKCAFDEKHLLNPGKVFPTLHRCAELGRMHIHKGQLPFPDIPGSEAPLEIAGNGSKRAIGRPVGLNYILSTAGLCGVTLYEPEELVMRAGPGTPMKRDQAAA
jgi:FAD/FMN-containing dehydrogenase